MISVKISEIFQNPDGFYLPDDEESCDDSSYTIYVFRDKETLLYIGYSRQVETRVLQHLAFCDTWGTPTTTSYSRSPIGNIVLGHLPNSLEWEIDFYSNKDVLLRLKSCTRFVYKARSRSCSSLSNS